MTTPKKTLRRMTLAIAGLGLGLALAACGGDESDDEVQAQLVTLIADSSGVSEADAACIVDQALDQYTLTELASLNGSDPDPELTEEVGRISLECLLEGDSLPSLLEDDQEDGEADGEGDEDDGTIGIGADAAGQDTDDGADVGDEVAFCQASADYWVASNAVNQLDRSDPANVRVAFERLDVRLDQAIAAAPNPQLAEPPLAARGHLTVIHENLAAFDYDWEAFEISEALERITADVAALQEIEDLLEQYLESECGVSLNDLQERGRVEAEAIEAAAGGQASEERPADGYRTVTDSSDRLKVDVPNAWGESEESNTAGRIDLTIAPDVDRYRESWATDGMMISMTEASSPVDWRSPMYDTAASSECTLVSSEPYEDALYVGWIDRYEDCGSGSTAVVVGATDADFSFELLVEIQFDSDQVGDDEATLQRVLDTFAGR